jgi:hypothetical protein
LLKNNKLSFGTLVLIVGWLLSACGTPTTSESKPSETTNTVAPTRIAPTPMPNPAQEPLTLRFSEFYAGDAGTLNPPLSNKLKSADGKTIKIVGYMAPPLKPDLDFFVLTRIRLSSCPFCSTAAEWPQDIILVTMPQGKTFPQIEEPITVTGRLEIGEAVDPQTGFFSLLRLRAQEVEVFKGS